jgi:hypothetical protein
MTTARDFDHAERLNDDGTVTLTMSPSTWHRYPLVPDTYQSFNGDSWAEDHLEWIAEAGVSEVFGDEYAHLDSDVPLTWDHFEWEYDHAAIVRALAEELATWMQGRLWDLGLDEIDVKVTDTWSPAYYNFQSDGFTVEVTCDPVRLRELTEGFDVDAWGVGNYSSYDGFHSFVTGRLREDDWHAEYDGAFRIEYLLAEGDPHGERDWMISLAEAEWEIYSEHVTVTPNVEAIREAILEAHGYMDSGYTLAELEAWAREAAVECEGQLALDVA